MWQWGEDLKSYLAEGLLCKGLDQYSQDWEYALGKAEETPALFLDLFARGSYEIPTKTLVNMTAKQLSPWGGGVELLAEDLRALLDQGRACPAPEEEAAKYLDPGKGVETVEDALAGASDIIAEAVSDDAALRGKLRALLGRSG